MEDGAALLHADWLGSKWLEGWKIDIKLPCGRLIHANATKKSKLEYRLKRCLLEHTYYTLQEFLSERQ
jgi:hypothetical protein